MVFSSIIFIFCFLPATLAAYYCVGPAWRNRILLLSSLAFYFWGEGKYLIVMIFYMVFNYLAGIFIERLHAREKQPHARMLLLAAIATDLGVLIYFKYAVFILGNLGLIATAFNTRLQVPDIHLPIGISFFSFQAISYLIDIYRRDVRAEKSLIDFSTYKALFPQLIAGPIIRYRDIAHQISQREHSLALFASGARRFISGLAKKVLIANSLSPMADAMFATSPQDISCVHAWLGVLCYALQIYFDFSGYSDMAIGLGRMFGFTFLENFNYPYIARSLREFWHRWHISLSSWFRDYVYISLGGNHHGKYRTWLNLLIVFFLCGIWHGASWTFVVWGLWHGIFLILERTRFGRLMAALPAPAGLLYTLILVLTGWVFFRADSLHQALLILKQMTFLWPAPASALPLPDRTVMMALIAGIIGATPLPGVFAVRVRQRQGSRVADGLYQAAELVWLFAIFMLSIVSLSGATYNPFIYFRF